jgi:hypothetical protein
MKSIFLSITVVLLFISCQEKEEFKTITIAEKYSMELPSSLTKSENLNDNASLQYQNTFKELYAIAIDETKEAVDPVLASDTTTATTNLDKYTQLLKSNFEKTLTNFKCTKIEKSQINGLDAQTYSINGTIDNVDVYYEVAFIEGRENYYQILVWTKLDQKEEYSKKMKDMVASFKELRPKNLKKRLPN